MPRFREFDTDQALARIKHVFWEQGFEGASMARIEQATGLKKQSLYRAFGDKRAMYLAALRDYERIEVAAAIRLLQAPGSARERVDALLGTMINKALESGDRRGCLLCNASVDQAPLDAASSELVGDIMQRFEQAIERCLARDVSRNSDAPRAAACAILAGYFGIRVMIKAGQPRGVLDDARLQLVARLVPNWRYSSSPRKNSS